MGVNEEIRQANLERMKSIEYQFMEKSMSDDLQYGIRVISKESPISDSGILISNDGQEIKQKLQVELSNISSIKQKAYGNLSDLSKEIGFSPIKEPDTYRAKDWKGKIMIPLIYCYSQMYDEISKTDVPEAKMMRQYNNTAREFFDKSIEEKKVNTIINAIDDKKKYKLTVDLASKLGF